MAIPDWPQGLPDLRGQASAAGSKSLHPAAQETQFDDGPTRARRRSLFVTTPLNMALVMSAAQFVIFKAFHLNDLNTGARRFTGRVLLPDLVTIGSRICRIQGEVSWSSFSPTHYLVSFTLIVQDW